MILSDCTAPITGERAAGLSVNNWVIQMLQKFFQVGELAFLKSAQEVQTQFYNHYLFLTLIVNDFIYFL